MKTDQLHQWEAMATHDELRAKYMNRVPAMRRRFRVENSRAGTGRLAYQSHAQRDAARCGGEVVEVIPLIPPEVRQAKQLPACPFCEAEAGQPCTSRRLGATGGKVRTPHSARWTAFHKEES